MRQVLLIDCGEKGLAKLLYIAAMFLVQVANIFVVEEILEDLRHKASITLTVDASTLHTCEMTGVLKGGWPSNRRYSSSRILRC